MDASRKPTLLITGANSGLGFELAKQAAEKGQKLILACRTLEKAQNALTKLESINPKAHLFPIELDLSDLESVERAVQNLPAAPTHIAANAGLSYGGKPQFTAQGYELTFGVNHLGHFALCNRLLNAHAKQIQSIVVVSSNAHNPTKTKGFFPAPNMEALETLIKPENNHELGDEMLGRLRYVNSKLANLLYAYELDRRLRASGKPINVNAYHPGFIPNTNIGRHTSTFTRFLLHKVLPHLGFLVTEIRKVEDSARDLLQLLSQKCRGTYFNGSRQEASSPLSKDEDLARRLWQKSEEWTSVNLAI